MLPEVRNVMQVALRNLDGVDVLVIRSVLGLWIPTVLDCIESGRIDRAANIVDFLHNLPIDKADLSSWNIDYFLAMSLPQFLETFPLTEVPREALIDTISGLMQLASERSLLKQH